MAPEKIAPKAQASSSVWNPLVKQLGFVPQDGKEAILLHPDSGVVVYFLPPSAGMKVSSNWQVGETTGQGWQRLELALIDLGVSQLATAAKVIQGMASRPGSGAVLNNHFRPGAYQHQASDSMPLINIDVELVLSDGTTRVIKTQAKHLVGAVATARGTVERTMTVEELAMVVEIRPKKT